MTIQDNSVRHAQQREKDQDLPNLSTEVLIDNCLDSPLTSKIIVANGKKTAVKLGNKSKTHQELFKRNDAADILMGRFNGPATAAIMKYDSGNFLNSLHFFRNIINTPLLLSQNEILNKLNKEKKVELIANSIVILNEMLKHQDRFGLTTLSYIAYLMSKIMTGVDRKLFKEKLSENKRLLKYLTTSNLPDKNSIKELTQVAEDFIQDKTR